MIDALNRGWKSQGQLRYEYLDRFGRLHRFRSGEKYELGVAKLLDQATLSWWYEPHALLLSDGRTYHPDFYVQEWSAYVEVKGRSRRLDKVVLARADGYAVHLVRSLKEMRALLETRVSA